MAATKKPNGRSGAFAVQLVSIIACLVAGSPGLLAQVQVSPPQPSPAQLSPSQPLPTGFRGIALGMEIDRVKQVLAADPLFGYRGDPDVSLLPQTEQYLIECAGPSYVHRAYFQFADRRLLTMILVLDTEKLDYFSLFSALNTKYGQPTSLSPEQSVWQSDSVRLSLEKPLTVKYLDSRTFASLVTAGGAPSDLEKLSREKFIEQF